MAAPEATRPERSAAWESGAGLGRSDRGSEAICSRGGGNKWRHVRGASPSGGRGLDSAARLGAWRSLVARGLWVAEVPGSNPGAPIKILLVAFRRGGKGGATARSEHGRASRRGAPAGAREQRQRGSPFSIPTQNRAAVRAVDEQGGVLERVWVGDGRWLRAGCLAACRSGWRGTGSLVQLSVLPYSRGISRSTAASPFQPPSGLQSPRAPVAPWTEH